MRKPTRSWRKWHRWGGLLAALPVIVLVVTGLLLNHSDRLALSEHRLPPSLAGWYGVELSESVTRATVTSPPLHHAGDRLFLGEKPLAACPAPFYGAVSAGRLVAAACDDALLLLSPDGELLDHLGAAWGLPAFQGLGSWQGQVVLETGEGPVALNVEQLTTEPLPAEVQWQRARTRAAPAAVAERLRRGSVPAEINWQRWLLDVHSGRIAGAVGILIMDLAALLLFALAMTGLVIWWRSRKP